MSLVLYRKQREILDFLRNFISANGFAPTIREIAAGVGISSPATVAEHLQSLERKEVIRRTRGKKRSLEIRPEFAAKPGAKIPILGEIAAGEPIEAIQNQDSFIDFPAPEGPNVHFALRIKGNSMVDDGILDGDMVIIRRQETCQNGDVVVALLADGSATLKRLYRENRRIRLQPANSELGPIYVEQVRIQGKVIGLVRKL